MNILMSNLLQGCTVKAMDTVSELFFPVYCNTFAQRKSTQSLISLLQSKTKIT
jgi:hypothetical protein